MWTCAASLNKTWSVIETFADGESFEGFTDDDKQSIVDQVLCGTPYWPGDEYESSAPSDVTFWVVHPTNERLLQYKDIVRPFTEVGATDSSQRWGTRGLIQKRAHADTYTHTHS